MSESLSESHEFTNARRIIAGVLVGASAISLAACSDSDPTKVTAPPSVSTTSEQTPTAEPTPSENMPASTLPTEDFSPTPSGIETSDTNPEMPTNGISYEDAKKKFEELTIEDIHRLVEANDIEAIANHLAFVYLEHITNGAELLNANSFSNDCYLAGVVYKENPIIVATSHVTDPKTLACSHMGINNIMATQVESGQLETVDDLIDTDRAQKVAELAYGIAVGSGDPYSASVLKKAYQNIDATKTVYQNDFEGIPSTAEILESGTMEFNGVTIEYRDMSWDSGGQWGEVYQRIGLVETKDPIFREVPITEQPVWNTFLDPVLNKGYGEMLFETQDDGTGRPVAQIKLADPGEVVGVDDLTIPIPLGSPSSYKTS